MPITAPAVRPAVPTRVGGSMMMAPLFHGAKFDSLTVKGDERTLRGRYTSALSAGFEVKERNGEFSFRRITYHKPPKPPTFEKERPLSSRDLASLATGLRQAGGAKHVALAKAAELAAHPKGLLHARENGSSYISLGSKVFEIVAETPEMKRALLAAAKKSANKPALLAELQGQVKTLGDRQVFSATNIRSTESLKGFSGQYAGKGSKTTVTHDVGGGKTATFALKAMNDDVKAKLAVGITNYNPPPVVVGKKVGNTIEVWDVNFAMHYRPPVVAPR